jgi:RimJ/RimL family protein N-acetyltransferase
VTLPIELTTERLLLRQWRPADRAAFAAMNADPRVMEHFPSPLTAAQSDATADRCESHIRERGWGPWAVERRDGGDFIGMVGLHVPSASLPFSPCVEVLWRLAFEHWGRGYATESAAAAVEFGFAGARLDEIVAFTVPSNLRSLAVMRRLGMTEAGHFDHPLVPPESVLRRHVLYRSSAGVRSR